METELDRHIRILDGMIERAQAGAERAALTAAYNRLVSDRWRAKAGRRKPSDWPFCEACGQAFGFELTNDDSLHAVTKNCECKGGVVFKKRPFISWGKWEEQAHGDSLS